MIVRQNALTIASTGGLLRAIESEVGVALPGPEGSLQQSSVKLFKGIWDTGATNCVVTSSVVEAVGLKPTGMTMVHTANGSTERPTFLVDVVLPNRVVIQGVKATLGDLVGQCDVLIGMDVITLGDFSVSNFEGKTVMSFRLPSMEKIDYVQSLQASTVNRAARRKKPKRKR